MNKSVLHGPSESLHSSAIRRIHPQLPVFRLESPEGCILYTPGRFAAAGREDADLLERSWKQARPFSDPFCDQLSGWLTEQAQNVVAAWESQRESAFAPECLTVHSGNACQLACSYCFTAQQKQRPVQKPLVIPEAAVRAAAALVAEHCARRHKPLTLVLTGGGEPVLHWKELVRTVDLTRAAARKRGIDWFGYIATGGVMPEEQARWLGEHMDRVGLSCDGPPVIQNRQRPLAGGGATAARVEQTARAIRAGGASLTARATITPGTMRHLTDIVSYLHNVLGADTIRVEPVFKHPDGGFALSDAPAFVEHFLSAQHLAEKLGCSLYVSGVRPGEVHGPYCDPSRNVLRLLPDGTVGACFLPADSGSREGRTLQIGYYDAASGVFVLNEKKMAGLRKRALQIPAECADCINVYHCDRSCPDRCLLAEAEDSVSPKKDKAQFRCVIWRQLTEAAIRRAAADAAKTDPGVCISHQGQEHEQKAVEALTGNLPASIDRDAIERRRRKARIHYRLDSRTMPAPVWARRGFDHDGQAAWRHLRKIAGNTSACAPVACYIHIPFCNGRCGFCDCYTLHPGARLADMEARYVAALVAEMDAWAGLSPLAHRPVSTVHFGGGTPNCLSAAALGRLVSSFRSRFRTTPQTEWALESTSRLLTPDHLRQLRELGFSRLHVGVQTLEEPLRRQIGRSESADVAAGRIEDALKAGFITSVDLIYGLPGQTAGGFLESVERLIALGISGASLYRLNFSARNRRFLETFAGFFPDAPADYVLFEAAHQLFDRAGWRKNHFCHFSLPADQNLYYTHARRKEDLLALGASADGVFGGYRYRHPLYKPYLDGTTASAPALQGGVMATPPERAAHDTTIELMCGSVKKSTLEKAGGEALAARWLEAGLLEEDAGGQTFLLTGAGSWLISNMIGELQSILEQNSGAAEGGP